MEEEKVYLRRTINHPLFKRGGIFDLDSYMGLIRFLIFSSASLYLLWHSADFFAWIDATLGVAPYPIKPKQQSPYPTWAQIWAVIIGGSGILASLIGMILVFIERRRLHKSAEGQWYNDPSLTKDVLYDKALSSRPKSAAQEVYNPQKPE